MTSEEKRKKHAEYQRKRYHNMTPEQKKQFLERRKPIMKKYRENNKEKINKHIREYYQDHKDKKSEINKRYYQNHKDSLVTSTSLKREKEDLIKYLEKKKIERRYANDVYRYTIYKDILERIKSGKYE